MLQSLMPRFFVKQNEIQEDRLSLSAEDAHHITRVLRMKVGEELTVCDFCNTVYRCVLTKVAGDTVEAAILSSEPSKEELPFPVTLCMALPKGDKMEWIIQKAVELGVSRIQPFSSAYTVMKLNENTAEKKKERWQKIAKAAAEQCGRGCLPEICYPTNFKGALEIAKASELRFICYEAEDRLSLKQLFERTPMPQSICFLVGSEGGFDKKEIEAATKEGLYSISLGKRILRCETAPLHVLSCIGFTYDC